MTLHIKNIDLHLEIDILTSGTVAEFVNEILEFLLYQRNQIPFVYRTYKYYVGRWSEQLSNVSEVQSSNQFQLARQRDLATKTKDAISDMRELIRATFKKQQVKSLRFLFGATTYTPKESYTIHIPTSSLSKQHFHEHHQIPNDRVNQTLISLITREELYTLFSTALPATNVFLELELLETFSHAGKAESIPKVFPKDISQLPYSCKDIHMRLKHSRAESPEDLEKTPKCCRDLPVYEDLLSVVKGQETFSCKHEHECNIDTSVTAWWEADIIVRGFKEQTPKALSIWSN